MRLYSRCPCPPQLDGLRFNRLLRCYLDDNRITNSKTVTEFVSHCTALEEFSLAGNPIVAKSDWKVRLVPRVSMLATWLTLCIRWLLQEVAGKLLSRLPQLRTLNNVVIEVPMLLQAARRFGTADDQRSVALRMFSDSYAAALCEVCFSTSKPHA